MDRLLNDINLDLDKKININKLQENFLESKIFKIINIGLNYGIRKILPDFIEEQAIDLKDNIINNGIKEGLGNTIKDVIKEGKDIMELMKGDVSNINQMQNVMKSGNLIDEISKLMDYSINMLDRKDVLDKKVLNNVKNGKDIIMSSVKQNIEDMFKQQINYIRNLENNIKEWKKGFETKDLSKMNRLHKNIMKGYNQIVPFEKLIKEARMIDDIHKRIQNRNGKIELNENEMNLIKILN